MGPKHLDLGQMGPGRLGPGQMGPRHLGPGQMGPGRLGAVSRTYEFQTNGSRTNGHQGKLASSEFHLASS